MKRKISAAIAVAAFTFLILLLGSKFYAVYALQKPIANELLKYNISKINYNQQQKEIELYVQKNSDLPAAAQDVFKNLGDIKIIVKDNPSTQLKDFYNKEELYITQYIGQKQYGTLQDYLKQKAVLHNYHTDLKIDDHFLYLKIDDGKTTIFKIYPISKESGV